MDRRAEGGAMTIRRKANTTRCRRLHSALPSTDGAPGSLAFLPASCVSTRTAGSRPPPLKKPGWLTS